MIYYVCCCTYELCSNSYKIEYINAFAPFFYIPSLIHCDLVAYEYHYNLFAAKDGGIYNVRVFLLQ